MPPRCVRDPVAVDVLEQVFRGKLDTYRLMELISSGCSGQASKDDALSPARKPRFTYQISRATPANRPWPCGSGGRRSSYRDGVMFRAYWNPFV